MGVVAAETHGEAQVVLSMPEARLSFLDGLRGWGAVFVVFYHVFCEGFPVEPAISPFLSKLLPFNGPFAVLVFFAVSGFSLAYRYLSNGSKRELAKIALGRYPRLIIPIFAVCLIVHLAMVTGIFDQTKPRQAPFDLFLNFEPTWRHLLSFATWSVFFNYDARESYVLPLWTMSIELFGSALVLVAVWFLGNRRIRVVLLASIGIAIAFLAPTKGLAQLSLFPAGGAIAEGFRRGWIALIPNWIAVSLIGVACVTPFVFPSDHQLVSIAAACMLIVGCIACPMVRRGLESGPSKELGRLSFPLYLIHGPIMWIVGLPLIQWTGDDASFRFVANSTLVCLSFAAAYCFLPVNEFAIRMSRKFGEVVLGRRHANEASHVTLETRALPYDDQPKRLSPDATTQSPRR